MKTLVGALAFVLILGCSPDGSVTPSGPDAWSLGPAPVVVIGEVEGDAEFLFQRISSVRLLADGGVAVADLGSASVRLFDSLGTFLDEWGRKGQGPGEFQLITTLLSEPSGALSVYDLRLQRLTRFSSQGELLGTTNFVGEDGFPEIFLGETSDGQFIVSWIKSGPRDTGVLTPDIMPIGRFGSDGRLDGIIATTTGFQRFGGSPIPFTPTFHAFLHEDRVYYTDGTESQLSVVDVRGETLPALQVEMPPIESSAAMAILETTSSEAGGSAALERFEGAPRDRPIPKISEVVKDDRGRFWMKRYDPETDSHALGGWAGAEGGEWIVLDPERGHIATVQVPQGFILMDVRGDRATGVVRDEWGVERVAVYRVSH